MTHEVVLEVSGISKKFDKDFWALKNISFEIKAGEIVGIIGKNGAGKSTLFKILSEIIAPTKGSIKYKGNIFSILDIGTGFHPDLSGRENILLNASLLGMSKKQIVAKMDEIISFSDIGHFIEQPVKTYSSGMYLRLAFSIAVHVDAQIMLLDEVIAVGDRDFKNKCYQKIRELARKGITIMVISHHASQILEFCERCLWIDAGEIRADGNSIEVLEKYLYDPSKKISGNNAFSKVLDFELPGFIKINELNILNDENDIYIDSSFNLNLQFDKMDDEASVEIGFTLTNMDGIKIFTDSYALRDLYLDKPLTASGSYNLNCNVPANLLNRGVYTISILICKNLYAVKEIEQILNFVIKDRYAENSQASHFSKMNTLIKPLLEWKINKSNLVH